MRFRKRIGQIGAIVFVSFSSLAQAQTGAVTFTSSRAAIESWQKITNAANRQAIFNWFESNALHCPEKNISEFLRDFSRVCLDGQSRKTFSDICVKLAATQTDPELRQLIRFQLADWYFLAADYATALETLEAHSKAPDISISNRVATAGKMAQILTGQLGRPAEAAALIASLLESVSPEENPSLFADLANSRSSILFTQMRDLTGAEAECRRVLAFGTNCSPGAYIASAERLALILAQTGKTNEAAAASIMVLRVPSYSVAGVARKIIDSGANSDQLYEAVNLLRSRMAEPFSSLQDWYSRVERCQPEIVELLLYAGRPEEALLECRAFALSASNKVYPAAIELAARCLKSLDGNLGRANALLEFHSSAPPPAGSVNPLMDFPALSDPVRQALIAGNEKPPVDWSGWINRSALMGWLDRPSEAMESARMAFVSCPISSNTLQACANAVARPVLIATRDPKIGQRLTDFLLLGAPGADGRIGTADDIADPFPEARQRISYGAMPQTKALTRKE